MKLGCCYYPEHWPEAMWEDDARRMAELGLTYVRIGEFAWSRIEPEDGRYAWDWLDRAVAILANAGLKIIMGTPTATPPKWLIDKHPDILPKTRKGETRNFGSRRHYSFSSQTYHCESARIVEAMAERYGDHPAIAMWQTDNEYGCHDTVESDDEDARAAFRVWLAGKYGEIDKLNTAWGTIFWSMEYNSFEEIDPPLATVTEPQPSHVMDWRRFSSDQVARYNQMQVEIIRRHAPGVDITHNYMGHFTEFDHHTVSKDIDIATWDSYPLGFLDQAWWDPATKVKYARTGHPDFAAFHHDLYRGMCEGGRWGIMEQQPGPVNWAHNNPAPLDGMVKLWTLEAAAHGAELVSYFRWRQAPFAQEQMHAGLNRPDNVADMASHEAASALADLLNLGALGPPVRADVALIYAYEAKWMLETQPQGRGFHYDILAFSFYSALRKLGLSVDIIGPDTPLDGYKLIAAPSLPMITAKQVERLKTSGAELVFGPRTGSKTPHLTIPDGLAPGPLADILPLKVWRVESLRRGLTMPGEVGGQAFNTAIWRELVETDLPAIAVHADGTGAAYTHGAATYLSVWPDDVLLDVVLEDAARKAGLTTLKLPEALRLRRCADLVFATNYGHVVDLAAQGIMPETAALLAGERLLARAGVSVWRE